MEMALVIRRFFVIFIPLAIILSISFAYVYYTENGNKKDIVAAAAINDVGHHLENLSSEVQLISSDLLFLSQQFELNEFIDINNLMWREDLALELLAFSEEKGIYDQIRFIDETGMEIIRVNYNSGHPNIVPDEELQSKASRYYFEDTFILEEREIFISPFDLNIEHGEVELPLKPMIRLGTPIFDTSGEKQGIFILNYLGIISSASCIFLFLTMITSFCLIQMVIISKACLPRMSGGSCLRIEPTRSLGTIFLGYGRILLIMNPARYIMKLDCLPI